MMKKIRVLYPLVLQPIGGVGTFLKNLFETVEGYELTIIESTEEVTGAFNDYFVERHVPIALFPPITKPVAYFQACKRFYQEHASQYDIVHLQSPVNALPHLYYAKKYGIPHRIYHSHATNYSDTRFKSFRNWLLLKVALVFATDLVACGQLSGEKIFKKRNFSLIPNGIDVQQFRFNEDKRIVLRNEYQISQDSIVIGCIGSIDKRKNQQLLIEMMRYLPSEQYELVLIGTGDREEILQEQAKGFSNIHFLGGKENIADFYSMMDIVALPSKFEGFPMVALEAQASGLPMMAADSIDSTINVTGEVYFSSIQGNEVAALWAEQVQQLSLPNEQRRNQMNEEVRSKGYDQENVRSLLRKYYEKLLGVGR